MYKNIKDFFVVGQPVSFYNNAGARIQGIVKAVLEDAVLIMSNDRACVASFSSVASIDLTGANIDARNIQGYHVDVD